MSVLILRYLYLPLAFTLLVLATTGCFSSQYGELQRAEELSRQNKIDEAIQAYRQHMENRLAIKDRREWENPHFYLVIIGDLELGRGNVDQALAAYHEALEKGVHESLISDRYRSVANWYEGRGELDKAFDHLKQYRELDTLLFDAQMDRLAREIVRREEESRALGSPKPVATPTVTKQQTGPALHQVQR